MWVSNSVPSHDLGFIDSHFKSTKQCVKKNCIQKHVLKWETIGLVIADMIESLDMELDLSFQFVPSHDLGFIDSHVKSTK